MSGNKPQIEFVEVRQLPPAPSGGQRAGADYIFKVDGTELAVRISYRTARFGDVPKEKIIRAAKTFLETEAEHRGPLSGSLTLDAPTMDLILKRLD